jgi:hypothetical protein
MNIQAIGQNHTRLLFDAFFSKFFDVISLRPGIKQKPTPSYSVDQGSAAVHHSIKA